MTKDREISIGSSSGLKVARISTVAFFVETQLKQQILDMIAEGLLVTVIASEPALENPIAGANYKSIKIPREISVINDLFAIFKLYRFFRKNRLDIVHSTTPKAGLVTAVAAYMARVPVRIHTYTGQVWVEKKGLVRFLAKRADQLIAWLNTQCYADSPSQVTFLLKNHIVPETRIKCLGWGSLAGVDLVRFSAGNYSEIDRLNLRAALNIPSDHKVLTFIGRCTRDKGIAELLKAFEQVIRSDVKAILLIVGPVEGNALAQLGDLDQTTTACIRQIGFAAVPEKHLAISDLFVLPSYREGFGTVVIEAAAMSVPAIGTQIYGLKDAIVDNQTGCLVPVKNVPELAAAMRYLLIDDQRRQEMGRSAFERVRDCFSDKDVNQLLIKEYLNLISNQRSST